MKYEDFKKVDGKIVVSQKERYKPTGKEPNYNSKYALKRINQEINNMKWEISKSEKSSSSLINDEHGRVSHRAYSESTFPDYMRKAGINSKNDFDSVIKSGKGIRFNRVKSEAINRINNGYQNKHGFDMPDLKFKVKTGQLHDNKDVIFRRVGGRIVPMRVPKQKRYDLMEDAPF